VRQSESAPASKTSRCRKPRSEWRSEALWAGWDYPAAETLYREIVQLRRAGLKADHKDVLDATASLARLLSDWAWAERARTVAAKATSLASPIAQPSTINFQLSPNERAREAEKLLREVLAVRLRDGASSWRIGDAKSRLGGALVSWAVTDRKLDAEGREAKLSEAEALLLDGHGPLQSSSTDEKYKRDAIQRLVRLYDAWNKPDKRAEWQQKVELLDKVRKESVISEK
jgi:hypothetical protein